MKNIIKKISAIAMCGVLTVGSVLMTGAVSEYEDRKDFEVTGTTQKISNNQLFVTTTGYTENTEKISVQSSKQPKKRITIYGLRIVSMHRNL